jgi:hypothetical protein
MNDKDFDQIFSDKLNEESVFSGADENWQKLNFRLDLVPPAPVLPAPPTPTIGWHPSWVYAAMSALAVGNIWLWLQMRDVNRQNKALQKAVTAVQTNRKDTVYRIDTVYQKVYLIGNQSNTEKEGANADAEYATLSMNKVAQNRSEEVVPSKSIESKSLKNKVAIENKKQQNIDYSVLNHPNKVVKTPPLNDNNTITHSLNVAKTAKSADNSTSTIVLNDNNTNSVDNSNLTVVSKDNPIKKVDNSIPTVVLNNNNTNSVDNGAASTFLTTVSKEQKGNATIGTTPITTDLTATQTADVLSEQNKILNKANLLLLPLDLKPLLPISSLEKEDESIGAVEMARPIKVKKQRMLPIWSMPEVNIGVIGTASLPSKQPTNGLGIGTDIGLSRNWSVIASVEKHESHFGMGHRDEKFHLPPEPQVPVGHKLVHLEGEFKDFRLNLGAKYVFMTSKKYRPYVTAQHVWKKAPASIVAFDYEKPTGETDRYIQSVDTKSFANIWQVGGGVTGDFNNRFSWNTGLNYMFDFNQANHNINPLTLRAGVYYRL